ncbi:hypothetical protein BD779DRAFT_1475682 [Infundibulicybe gibba]|nr:hypothetical protein BD779DRAFT_1475682 [Infundibulicybe gibba]
MWTPGPLSLFAIVLFSAVVTKSARLQLILFAILLLLYGYIIFVQRESIDPLLDYNVGGITTGFLARASDFILLTDAQSTLRQHNQSQSASQMTFTHRSRWAIDLILNFRGVGWSFEAPHLNRSTLQRWKYVRSQLGKLVIYFLLSDLASFHNRHSRVFNPRIAEPMGDQGIVWQAWNVFMLGAILWAPASMHYTLASIIAVASGLSQPGDWPECFGSWLKTDSVRNFWGFCLLGLIHAAGDWKMAHNVESAKRNVHYFILQAVAITSEDIFFGLAKRWGFPRASRLIGRVWFVGWMVWSGPILMETMIRGGCVDYKPLVSVVERVYQRFQG